MKLGQRETRAFIVFTPDLYFPKFLGRDLNMVLSHHVTGTRRDRDPLQDCVHDGPDLRPLHGLYGFTFGDERALDARIPGEPFVFERLEIDIPAEAILLR